MIINLYLIYIIYKIPLYFYKIMTKPKYIYGFIIIFQIYFKSFK